MWNPFKKKYYKRGYVIHKTSTRVMVCKILNEYASEEEAENDLVSLLTHKIKEEDLLDDFMTKQSW